jgi:tetratricopeptide (TPR) repeat protein
MLNKYAEAIGDYSKAIEATPDNGDIYYNRAFSYQRLQQPEKACADWLKAEQLGHPAAAGMLKQFCGSGK